MTREEMDAMEQTQEPQRQGRPVQRPAATPVAGEAEWGAEGFAALVAALAAAQAKFGAIVKTRTAKIQSNKGAYSYDYADLSDVIDAVKIPLAEAGLAFFQPATNLGPVVTVRTIIAHAGGGWLKSPPITVVAESERPQALGSAITYARRYSLGAMLGISPESDDDGNTAEGNHHQTEQRTKQGPKQESPRQEPAKQPAKTTPPHVGLAWKRVKSKLGQDAASIVWEAAARAFAEGKPTTEWTPATTAAVEAAITDALTSDAVPDGVEPAKWSEEVFVALRERISKSADIAY